MQSLNRRRVTSSTPTRYAESNVVDYRDREVTLKTKNAKSQIGKSVTFEPKNAEELSRFFEVNKDKYHEIWIVLNKKKRAKAQPASPFEALTEAIRHGLIDSRTKSLGDQKFCMRFTKRTPRSGWSEGNLAILKKIEKGEL